MNPAKYKPQSAVFLEPQRRSGQSPDMLARVLEERIGTMPAFKPAADMRGADAVISLSIDDSDSGRGRGEGYRIEISTRAGGRKHALVEAADVPSLWAAAGRCLQVLAAPGYSGESAAGAPFVESVRPAVAHRGVYLATHFQNYYERAPLPELLRYVEDLALAGFNMLAAWLDAAWYPEGFWRDPESRGARMSTRIRRLIEHARRCGMRAGVVGCANEAFRRQPPVELLADAGGRRGGFYPESTICPSRPGGLDMILENRRIIADLTGPVDFFVYWPYDQGGCGCELCKRNGGWAERFLEIGPRVCGAVKHVNPDAEIMVSTWMFDGQERARVYEAARAGPGWFDSVIGDARFAEEMASAGVARRYVFPEISMFGCMFTSYGCNGANPAPARFTEQARRVAAAGCGFLLYSEGIYEDANKAVWAAAGARPGLEAQRIIEDYAALNFGPRAAADAAGLIMGLERTWGAAGLAANGEDALRLAEAARSIGAEIPARARRGARWQALRYRAEMDRLMAEIGPDSEMRGELRVLLEELATRDDARELRRLTSEFVRRLAARAEAVRKLFDLHWRYLRRFHMQHTNLQFIPDAYLGKHDWAPLAASLGQCLAIKGRDAFRDAAIRAIKQWAWFRASDIEMWLL